MGTIALAGGGEFAAPYEALDRDLLEASGGADVLVLPTAAAYEHPDRAVEHARTWFAALGATATGCRVLTRGDAMVREYADTVRAARFVYLTGGSAMHLRSVLKRTPVWDALCEVVASGGVVAGSSAGAMVLCDPLTDPRGGAFTLGLGLVEPMAVVAHAEEWPHERLHRTLVLADPGLPLVCLDTGAAVVRRDDTGWRSYGKVTIYVDGTVTDDLAVLPFTKS
jgi:cyanophycinase